MSAPDGETEPERTSPADSYGGVAPVENLFHRVWKHWAPLRKGCAALGLILVFIIEIFVVPFVQDTDNIWPIDPTSLVHTFSTGYTFVDIDDVEFSEWKTSGHTNRSKIAELIERIVKNKPEAIVVDIDLSDRNTEPTDDTNDLKRYVRQYLNDEAKKNIPLIFVLSLQTRPKSSEKTDLETETAPLDAVSSLIEVPEPAGPIYFGSSGFLRSGDGKVRSWRLAEPACIKDQLRTIPSVELLLLPVRKKEAHLSEATLDPRYIEHVVQAAYQGDGCSLVRTTMHEIRISENVIIRLSPKYLRDRIIYSMKMPSKRDKNILTGSLRYVKANDRETQITNGQDLLKPNVVIGGSNEESRDIYNTPYGQMPGALVLVNATESLRTYHQLRELRDRMEIITGIIIGILVWFFLEFFTCRNGTCCVLWRILIGPWCLWYAVIQWRMV
jgi:hypothetical protein